MTEQPTFAIVFSNNEKRLIDVVSRRHAKTPSEFCRIAILEKLKRWASVPALRFDGVQEDPNNQRQYGWEDWHLPSLEDIGGDSLNYFDGQQSLLRQDLNRDFGDVLPYMVPFGSAMPVPNRTYDGSPPPSGKRSWRLLDEILDQLQDRSMMMRELTIEDFRDTDIHNLFWRFWEDLGCPATTPDMLERAMGRAALAPVAVEIFMLNAAIVLGRSTDHPKWTLDSTRFGKRDNLDGRSNQNRLPVEEQSFEALMRYIIKHGAPKGANNRET